MTKLPRVKGFRRPSPEVIEGVAFGACIGKDNFIIVAPNSKVLERMFRRIFPFEVYRPDECGKVTVRNRK